MSNVRKLATYTREFKLEAIQLAENKRLKETNEILKKATKFFVSQSK